MIPLSGRVPGRASEPSRTRVDDGGGDGCFSRILIGFLGFSRRGDYIGERAASVEARGGHTTWWHDRQVGRATLGCGRPLVRLRLPFGLRVRDEIIRSWVFVPSDSENISLSTFLKRKNSRKQELALGHLVNMLVPKMHKNAIRCKQNM